MEIAICDDEKTFVDDLYKKVLQYQKNKNIQIKVDQYTEAGDLIKNLDTSQAYDLILLDICMPQFDGISVSDYIRHVRKDNVTQIVYVSANTQYAIELFEYHPLDFLVKPIDEAKLYKIIDKALDYLHNSEILFSFKVGRSIYRIELKKIRYIYSIRRTITIECINQEKYEYYGKMDDVYKIVKDKGFIRVHKSYIVNQNYIRVFSANTIILDNNDTIPISRSWRGDISKICQQYI